MPSAPSALAPAVFLRFLLMSAFLLQWTGDPCLTWADEQGDTIVLTAEDVRASQALTMADVLNTVPGIKAGDSSVSIHGSYKVKVFLNGRPLNDPTSSHGGINWDPVSMEDVERIEILRGKGGLTYGQDAAGGVILISTKNVNRLTGNIKAYGGDDNNRNLTSSVSAAFGKLITGVRGGYETSDGYMANNDKEKYKAGLNLGYELEQGKTVDFSMDWLEDERGLAGLPEYPTPFSRKKTRNTAYALQAQYMGVKSKTSYNEGFNHNTDISRDLDKVLRVSKFRENLFTTFDSMENGELSCGADFTWDRANGSSFDRETEYSGAVFASQSLSLPKIHTTLTVGLRAGHHSTFDPGVNPEVKLSFKKPAWRLTGAYSRTRNIPSFYQRYNETSSTNPNPDLGMEKADNFSLALFFTGHDDFSFSTTFFYSLLTDRITYVYGDDGMGQYRNFGEVFYTGGDVAMSWQIHPALKSKASYTYLEAKDQNTELWIPCKARQTAHLDLCWQPFPSLSIVAATTWSSKVYRDQSNTRIVPAYNISDLRVEYMFAEFSLFSEIDNFFDKTYYYADGYLAPPRTWLVGVNWKF